MKKLIEWKPNYSVSVKSIDNDHQVLFDLLNQLFDAMSVGKGKDLIGDLMGQLHSYTVYHFGREEMYFRITNYPSAESHVKQHEYFIQKIVDFKKDLEAGKDTVTSDVLNFLTDWLKNHILTTDKAYEEHFKKYKLP